MPELHFAGSQCAEGKREGWKKRRLSGDARAAELGRLVALMDAGRFASQNSALAPGLAMRQTSRTEIGPALSHGPERAVHRYNECGLETEARLDTRRYDIDLRSDTVTRPS